MNQQQKLDANEINNHFNPASTIKTFSTRNKSSLSISTHPPSSNPQHPAPSSNSNNDNDELSSSARNYSSSPHSSPDDHAPIPSNSPPPATSSSTSHSLHPISPHQPLSLNQHSLPTSSFGPNVAGRIGVGGNIMVDPYNPSHPSHRGTIGAGAFVYKVYNMLLDPSFQHLISFNSNGQSFTVYHVQEFSKAVLPKHFKHNFVRQLNMYGFHKVNKTPRGQRGNDNSAAWEFLHPKFHRGRPDLLDQIRRKTLDHDSVPQPVRKDHPHLVHPQSSPTGYRFPLDTFSFVPNPSHHPPSYLLVHAGPSSPSTHLPLRPKSDAPLNLSPPAPTHNLHIPDVLNPPLSSPSNLLEGSSNTVMSPNQTHLFQGQSSDRYPNPFVHSPYSIDHISSNTSQTSSAPITPLSAAPPPSSPLNHTFDPNRFSNSPIEILMEMKNDISNRFQGVHVSYEQLYQELHDTRRKQNILIDLVEKMFKSLQSIPHLNLGYEFPAPELSSRSEGETTPIFKITEHDYPDHSPMIFEDCSSQQQCPVSVGTSPSLSEFSHANHASPGDSAYRSFSGCPSGFGSLTLSSYPNSPVGGLMGDKQQSSNKNSSHSPRNKPMVPDRSAHRQLQTPQNDSGLLETEPTNRFLNPTATGTHHSQQHMRPNEINSVPISPRETLSAALKIPLPPSPAPFKPIHQSGASINAPIENIPSQTHQCTDNYQHAVNTFIHSHHSNLPIIGEYKEPNRTFPPSINPSNPILVKTEDCSSNLTSTNKNNHSIQDSSSSSSSFDKMILTSSNGNLIFPSSSSTSGSPNTALSKHDINLIHAHPNSETDLMGFKNNSSKKRPASNSMDLSVGISHLNHHHLNQINQHHRHQRS